MPNDEIHHNRAMLSRLEKYATFFYVAEKYVTFCYVALVGNFTEISGLCDVYFAWR